MADWRDVSLIWLIFWTLIAVTPLAVLLFFAVMGMHGLRRRFKRWLPVVQDRARRVASGVEGAGQKAAAPVIAVRTRAAEASTIANAILRRKRP